MADNAVQSRFNRRGGKGRSRRVRHGRTELKLRRKTMKKLILALAAAATVGIAVPAAAQSVDQREHRQTERIREGERNGALTPREARRLHHREVRLHRTEGRMRARNGGYLTQHQRHRLHRIENRDSRAIHRLKHNHRHD
jgi:hypothetical protein